MKHLTLLLLHLILPVLLHAESSKPNIFVILADDLGYGIVNAYGSDPKRVATPNVDRLAKEGAKFTDGYVTCSVCGPSRAGLMTGRYQQRFGVYANCDTQSKDCGVPGNQTMAPRYFKDAGYVTAMIGKWHLGDKLPGQHPLEKGFDEYFGFNSAQTDYFNSPILFDGRTKVEKHDYLTRAFTDRAIQFIEKSGDKPFFIYLAYNAVHGPNMAPKETIGRFSHLPKGEPLQAAMVAELDDGIGRILGALDTSGKTKDTLVFFLSDNGGLGNWWAGSNGVHRGLKRHQFDGGNKVPFIVSWPAGFSGGQVRKQPAISLDILPTALDAAGVKAPAGEFLDGISLLPALKAQEDLQPQRPLFWAGSHYEGEVGKGAGHDNPPAAWAIRRGDWKLMQIMEQGPPMLFNVAADPAESEDLIKEQTALAAELQKAWVEWFKIGGDPIAWKSEYFSQLKGLREAEVADGLQPHFQPGQDPKPAEQKWTPVESLSDEFEGTTLDRTKWQDDPTANGWGWYGRAPGLFRAENVKLEDGKMCVTVSKLETPVVRSGKTFTHQGAIVRSLHPGQPGWYFECRMKANATVMSSTFWLVTKPRSGKRLELDIQECVGLVTEKTAPWAKKWDRIFHSNLIDWNKPEKVQLQGSIPTPTKNSERFYVYGAWWKSPEEARFYLDGTYVYSIRPKVAWDAPSFIQMAVETYDWNPVPVDGGLVNSGTWDQRTTQYDWVRVWKLGNADD